MISDVIQVFYRAQTLQAINRGRVWKARVQATYAGRQKLASIKTYALGTRRLINT